MVKIGSLRPAITPKLHGQSYSSSDRWFLDSATRPTVFTLPWTWRGARSLSALVTCAEPAYLPAPAMRLVLSCL
eukprot:scaffold401_cov144-Skeletonema_dohrnii-CCMP3373.AAC.2